MGERLDRTQEVAGSSPASSIFAICRAFVVALPATAGEAVVFYLAEAHRQSVAIAASEREVDDQAFVDAISSPWEVEDDEASFLR